MLKVCKKYFYKLFYFFWKKNCPLCGWSGYKMGDMSNRPFLIRHNVCCPKCNTVERHRLAYLLLDGLLKRNKWNIMHTAPEKEIEKWLRSVASEYISIDLYAAAMMKMDLTNMTFKDASFTLVWSSHVLEHIIDDTKAIAEIYRVLKPGGLAIIQLPIFSKKTYEDYSITDKKERRKSFFQEDHVRAYGLDVKERLESAGFIVEIKSVDDLDIKDVYKYQCDMFSTNHIFVCYKTCVL